MTIPLRLYKYEPFTSRTLQNLKSQTIYFGSPLNFNDPYDCALSPSIKELSDAEIEKIRDHYLSDPNLKDNLRLELKQDSILQLRSKFLSSVKKVLDHNISEFLKVRGVSCFAEKVDSLLMWSHYGDHCKGICLEFDTSIDLFKKVKKVQYQQKMPEIDAVSMLCDENFDQIMDLYRTKALDWAYENEWRGIHDVAGTAFCYPSNALTGVFLGPDMSFEAFEIVALILAGQNENVQLWQGARSKSSFKVEFCPVKYSSHLESKRKGLLDDN